MAIAINKNAIATKQKNLYDTNIAARRASFALNCPVENCEAAYVVFYGPEMIEVEAKTHFLKETRYRHPAHSDIYAVNEPQGKK